MKTILATGQSNALWYGEGGYWPTFPGVTVWDCENNRNDLVNLGTAFVKPEYGSRPFRENLLTGDVCSANNAAVHACATIARVLDEDVRLILVAMDDCPLSDWCDGSERGPLYDRMEAVVDAAGVTAVDAVFWQQGESDEDIYEDYQADWNVLVSFMRSDGIILPDTPIVIGTPTYDSPKIGEVLRTLARQSRRFGIAEISHLPLKDERRYSGGAAFLAGRIIAASYLKLVGA